MRTEFVATGVAEIPSQEELDSVRQQLLAEEDRIKFELGELDRGGA